jgi:hypothetical protein
VPLNSDLLDLIERNLVIGTIVELGGAGTLVGGHGLGVFERAAVVEIGRYARRTKSMITDRRRNTRVTRAPLQHGARRRTESCAARLVHPSARPPSETPPLAITRDAGGFEVILQIALENESWLLAFLFEALPKRPLLEDGPH